MTRSAPKVSIRRLLLKISLISTGLIFAAGIGLVCAVTWRPAWYQPVAIDFSRLDEDKAVVANLADEIGDKLNRGQSVTIELDESRLNRILAARDEWPQSRHIRFDPLVNPYLDLRDGDRLRLGAQLEVAGARTVLSFTLSVAVAEDVLTISIDEAAAGAAPAPRRALDQLTAQLIKEAGDRFRDHTGKAITITNDFIWPNGKVRCRLGGLKVEESKMKLTLVPR